MKRPRRFYVFWIGFAAGAAACAADNGDWPTVAIMGCFGLLGVGASLIESARRAAIARMMKEIGHDEAPL